ncbi:MAG: ATP synthase F1 subunit epsilon [Acidobacteriota bacterium]|nr:ATP synthase F1 subunit epsilon [Acidobacteriota bacterium]
MADAKSFYVSVVTPEKAVFEGDARFVAVPAHDGELGFMRNRAAILAKLDVGRLRIDTEAGEETFFVDGGFVEMIDNQLTILTEDARRAEELDREGAEVLLAEARAMKDRGEGTTAQRERTFKRARTQLRMLR